MEDTGSWSLINILLLGTTGDWTETFWFSGADPDSLQVTRICNKEIETKIKIPEVFLL